MSIARWAHGQSHASAASQLGSGRRYRREGEQTGASMSPAINHAVRLEIARHTSQQGIGRRVLGEPDGRCAPGMSFRGRREAPLQSNLSGVSSWGQG